MVAAANAHPDVCTLLLANGAEVNAHDEDGLSAFDCAEDLDGEEGDAVRRVIDQAGGLPGLGEGPGDVFDGANWEGGEQDTRGQVGDSADNAFEPKTPEIPKDSGKKGAPERHVDGRLKFEVGELDFDVNEDHRREMKNDKDLKQALENEMNKYLMEVRAKKEVNKDETDAFSFISPSFPSILSLISLRFSTISARFLLLLAEFRCSKRQADRIAALNQERRIAAKQADDIEKEKSWKKQGVSTDTTSDDVIILGTASKAGSINVMLTKNGKTENQHVE